MKYSLRLECYRCQLHKGGWETGGIICPLPVCLQLSHFSFFSGAWFLFLLESRFQRYILVCMYHATAVYSGLHP